MVLTAPSLGLGSCHGHQGVVVGVGGGGGGGGSWRRGGGEVRMVFSRIMDTSWSRNSESGVFIMIVPSL